MTDHDLRGPDLRAQCSQSPQRHAGRSQVRDLERLRAAPALERDGLHLLPASGQRLGQIHGEHLRSTTVAVRDHLKNHLGDDLSVPEAA